MISAKDLPRVATPRGLGPIRTRRAAVWMGVGLIAGLLPILSSGARAGTLAACPGSDWPMFGHDAGRSFSSPDQCINPVTAATLAPKWFFNTQSPVTAQPIVAGSTVFAGAFNGVFYAVNSSDGSSKWSFDVTRFDKDKVDYGVIPDSAAVATLGNRQIVMVGGGDTVFALDAADGTLLASQCLDRVDTTCQGGSGIVSEIESSPVIVPWSNGNALVLVGQDANEANPSGVKGVVALVLSLTGGATGGPSLSPLWQFDPETGMASVGLAPQETGHPTGRGCGDVWSSPAVDMATRTVVFGTGNCNRPASNPPVPQVESTFAVSLDTGTLKWQAWPHPPQNGLDLDFGATPNMLGGGFVGEGGKDGVYYAYNIAAGPNDPSNWKTSVSTASSIGGMIASPAVGQIATPAGPHQAVFADTAIPVSPSNASGSLQNDVLQPRQALGVHALDTVTHQVVWDAPAGPSYGAAVYDNGVVFTPETFMSALVVLDANTGVPIRTIPVSAPPASPVAVSGDTVYEGAGTTQNGLPGLSNLGGIWAFQTGA